MKPRDTVKQDTSDVVVGPTLHRDNVAACDTMNIMLLDSQGTVPLSSRNESQRSSISNAETVAIPQSLAAIALDTGHTFRDDFDHGIQIDTRGATEFYRIDDDSYRPFTIYGSTGDGKGKIATLPASTTGSLSSIITTSIASSEPDRVDHRSGGDGGTGCSGSLVDEVSDGRPLDQKCAISCGGIAGAPGASTDNGGDDGHGADIRQEKWWYMTLQIAIPFFVAGVGTIGAGIILGHVENWKVFVHISELFILVPSLLGLKGNLDMCLASRLSTQANLGNMSGRREIFQMVLGNIALVQVQATVASFIVSMFAVVVGAIINGTIIFDHVMLLTASAMFTATSSCFVLDFVLVAVILISSRTTMNPDNLATPLAASIGDVVSISLLAAMATLLFEHIDTHLWVTFVMVAVYVFLLPFWMLLVYRNKYTRSVLSTGWVPVLSALFISGMGGLVLDKAVGIFNGFVVFQPIINGIGGNLVSVQASKISTMLHQSSIIGIIPPHAKIFELPWRALFHGVPYARTARILIAMSIPGQVLFIFVADYIHMSRSTIGAPFVLSYLFVSTLQIMLLLYIAHIIIHLMWKWKIDPDNSAIPYLTALGDLFGSSFLMLAFLFLRSIGHPYGEKSSETVDGFKLLPELTTISGGTLLDQIQDDKGI
ncbi:solute carrier family 41 member 1 [Anopheles arabiensis]|uniref:SLC41A/MgtE integral membrane domain-containing protein n=1 Tax=Anopheles arabiensis TaxID=7173 RepID=A0A182I9Y1_ANOAR|nr:solute carrier family 41 member 1 [Anopheles arabiensis]XP_040173184.1 solute carrier family 41 member 1 [Anopheles arabiensis]XP_040173185.1 solute carrier family 41 member 1 [Anopheles arabiensis]XP_040173186.1 solute carrier family 41 member 1 [Anopheles arabiensis]XP_040173187.1 solute carrier family 41 member 1 [Anopheles arabiensis]XP_040173188.1 solute carrier family 41 member 1 [Anopheles arabiensis]